MLDAAYRKALNYWKSSFLAQSSDDAIDTMIECFARCPTPMGQLLLEHLHGAASRVGVGDRPSRTALTVTTCSCFPNGGSRQIPIDASRGHGKRMRRWSPSSPPAAM